ncbi:hypothetical protein [Campylobacter jejuni]|uniref:hypothetical protein n=1 Tax=Campylobacter jejuni TaxID=197 RepID=UPI00073DC9B1|nr:hypothetical protein [Campylobacter jejuni]ALW15623.1 hypothetical protein RC26_02720 [Campylobacter jejuni]HED5364346.1 hypothetical protein [Campylobacter jejuni]HEG5317658.1 hypothetical protein [Campylobacter jejuni]
MGEIIKKDLLDVNIIEYMIRYNRFSIEVYLECYDYNICDYICKSIIIDFDTLSKNNHKIISIELYRQITPVVGDFIIDDILQKEYNTYNHSLFYICEDVNNAIKELKEYKDKK